MWELRMFVGMNKSIVWKGQIICLGGAWPMHNWSEDFLKLRGVSAFLVNVEWLCWDLDRDALVKDSTQLNFKYIFFYSAFNNGHWAVWLDIFSFSITV